MIDKFILLLISQNYKTIPILSITDFRSFFHWNPHDTIPFWNNVIQPKELDPVSNRMETGS